MGDQDPRDFGCGGFFEVLREAAASAEPGKGALDDPSPRQQLEAFDARRALDDLDRPWTAMGDRREELFAAVNPIGKDMAQLRKALPCSLQQGDRAMTVLDVG